MEQLLLSLQKLNQISMVASRVQFTLLGFTIRYQIGIVVCRVIFIYAFLRSCKSMSEGFTMQLTLQINWFY